MISSHLPDVVSAYIEARAQRLEADKVAATLKEAEDDLKKVIIEQFRDQKIAALGAGNGTVKMKASNEPLVEDWPQVYAYIKENDAWEFLHKRITIAAVKERWEAGEVVPGVTSRTEYTLSVSK